MLNSPMADLDTHSSTTVERLDVVVRRRYSRMGLGEDEGKLGLKKEGWERPRLRHRPAGARQQQRRGGEHRGGSWCGGTPVITPPT
jgi:hypothetical protein